jgi:DNA polymerase-3 subunit delta
MDHNAFFKALGAGDIAPLYLLEGTEEYIKAQALARLCQLTLPEGMEAMNLTELSNPTADELIAAAETLPFLSERRVVIVRECDALTTAKKTDDTKAEAIASYLNRQSPATCILFTVKGKADARKKLYGVLKKLARMVDFSPMGDAEAANWAMRTMRALGKRMDMPTAQKLIFNVGNDAALLKQEMEKLLSYVGERDAIADEDIDAVCVKTLECSVFQLVEAQVNGRYSEAFGLLDGILTGGEDRFMVLSMLLRQYRILYHMRCLLDDRVPQAQLPALLGIPPFAVARTQAQARRYAKERLKAAYDYLFELEYMLKSGRSPQEGSAEAALFMLDGILGGQSA